MTKIEITSLFIDAKLWQRFAAYLNGDETYDSKIEMLIREFMKGKKAKNHERKI